MTRPPTTIAVPACPILTPREVPGRELAMFRGRRGSRIASDPNSIAHGDLNADGHIDMELAILQAGAAVLLGVGDETFQEAVGYDLSFGGIDAAIGDLGRRQEGPGFVPGLLFQTFVSRNTSSDAARRRGAPASPPSTGRVPSTATIP